MSDVLQGDDLGLAWIQGYPLIVCVNYLLLCIHCALQPEHKPFTSPVPASLFSYSPLLLTLISPQLLLCLPPAHLPVLTHLQYIYQRHFH